MVYQKNYKTSQRCYVLAITKSFSKRDFPICTRNYQGTTSFKSEQDLTTIDQSPFYPMLVK